MLLKSRERKGYRWKYNTQEEENFVFGNPNIIAS
jgi:hypothetical protein